jgi:hypothetical protein
LEVVVAVVGNRWRGLPGNLLGFHAWLQPSETKEMSIINHISLLLFSEDIPLLQICNSHVPFNPLILDAKIMNKMVEHIA